MESDKLGVYCSFIADKVNGLDSFTAKFTPAVAGEMVSSGFIYYWDFGDGSEGVSKTPPDAVEHAFAYPDTSYG